MKRLAIITTHPIQYNAPLFRALASDTRIDVKVFYTLGRTSAEVVDKGFGKAIEWDIPLLEGYEYRFLENISNNPSTSDFKGIVNPTIVEDIDEFRPSAILIFGWSFSSHLKVLRHFHGKTPIYFRGDSTLLNETYGIRKVARRLFLSWVYSHIDKAFYVGTNNKTYYLKHGVKEKNLIFAPHAIDNKRFMQEHLYTPIAKQIKAQLGIPEKNIVFAFIGKFEKVKNPLLLLNAFKIISTSDISLLFVGNGALEKTLKEESAGYKNVYFLPFQNQSVIPAVYRVADVLALPSVSETWGLAINEAMACGSVIVASNRVGCAVDLVHENKNGFIFEANTVEDLVDKLNICSSKSKDELADMGRVSKAIVSDWSFDHTCEAIINTLTLSS